MLVGIIVLCIPAAAHSCRHHSNCYRRLKSSFESNILRRNRIPQISNGQARRKGNVSIKGPYHNLDDSRTGAKRLISSVTRPHTVARSRNQHDIDEAGDSLTYEMRTRVEGDTMGEDNV